MAKVWTFIILTIGLSTMMELMGLPTGLDWLLEFFGLQAEGATLNTSAFFVAIGVLFAGSTGAGIIIGAFGRSAPEYALLAPFAAANTLILVSSFMSLINYAQSFDTWVYYPILTIFGVLGIGFSYAVVEQVFGRGD